jgi:antirestriction protein ArdC
MPSIASEDDTTSSIEPVRIDVYELVTNRIVTQLEQGVWPWVDTPERRARCRTYYKTASI